MCIWVSRSVFSASDVVRSIVVMAFILAAFASAPAAAEGPEEFDDGRLGSLRAGEARAERARLAEIAARERLRQAEVAAQLAERRRLIERYRLVSQFEELSSVAKDIARDDRIRVEVTDTNVDENEIVVDVDNRTLHFYAPSGLRVSFPVATARPDIQDYGVMRITKKRNQPTWIPTPNQRLLDPDLPAIVKPGPDNPLGSRALNLSRGYLRIHGTNEPETIGEAVSDGCVRLTNEHVELLYEMVDVGISVEIR